VGSKDRNTPFEKARGKHFMKARILLTIILAVVLTLTPMHGLVKGQNNSQEKDLRGGLIYGADHVFALTAPTGWLLDNTSGVEQGLHAVFYPKGSSWSPRSPKVMYANTVHKERSGLPTLKDVMEDDLKGFRKHSRELETRDEPNLSTKDNRRQAVVRYFHDKVNERYDEVAYIDESKVVVFLVLSAKTKKDYDEALPAFRQLVASYFFVSDQVTFEPKK
jgi:hypothetical protein